jgi:hypothetical protein
MRTKRDLMEKNIRFYSGLSSDVKPMENVGGGSKFYERDTGKEWIYKAKRGWQIAKGR